MLSIEKFGTAIETTIPFANQCKMAQFYSISRALFHVAYDNGSGEINKLGVLVDANRIPLSLFIKEANQHNVTQNVAEIRSIVVHSPLMRRSKRQHF